MNESPEDDVEDIDDTGEMMMTMPSDAQRFAFKVTYFRKPDEPTENHVQHF